MSYLFHKSSTIYEQRVTGKEKMKKPISDKEMGSSKEICY